MCRAGAGAPGRVGLCHRSGGTGENTHEVDELEACQWRRVPGC